MQSQDKSSNGAFVNGRKLATRGELFCKIIEKTKRQEAEAKLHLYQIVSAIQHLHSKNSAHRDLKPENIPLRTDDDLHPVVKVTEGDFSFPAKLWSKISEPAIELVNKLMTGDVGQRPSASDALNHAWLRDEEVIERRSGVSCRRGSRGHRRRCRRRRRRHRRWPSSKEETPR